MAFFTWHRISDPGTGYFASKTSGWTADSFSGGFEVDFSSVVPVGTKAVLVEIQQTGTRSNIYTVPADDPNVSNTPEASNEHHCRIGDANMVAQRCVVWLSATYKADFAVTDTDTDLNIAYPSAWLG